ncbi:helix-turn-helix domain-containing protein [Paenibacillus sp. GD4]|uniref:helix-turn-helix domain-containing protein n=1 Tax=Paenibacillus sp. GD4 TaxID=3068890 RepID=UPI0027967A3B|nr:helix-turn-helix domain-containing protein [Paenibacillus sp. GD4]MDQ1914028.1 helix-turn-helix domain-containing protein [Paenibacillus sp. GD4]
MRKARKSVFLTLWLSYLLILLIPVSISVLLYANVEKNMVDNANRSNLAMLEQAGEIMENEFRDIDRLLLQISTHPKLQTLWNLDNGEQYLGYTEAVTALRNMRYGEMLVDNFLIRLDQSDIILTPSMKTDTETYFSQIAPYRDMTVREVRNRFFSGSHFKTCWPSSPVMDTTVPKNVITCAVTLPLGERDNVRATLLIQLGERQMASILKKMDWAGEGSIFIVDAAGQVLFSTPKGRLPEEIQYQTMSGGHSETYSMDDQNYMVSYTKGESGWRYVSVIPESYILHRVNELKVWALTLLCIALLAGTGAALWMAYRSYSPIRDMVVTLLGGKEEIKHTGNDYEFIQSSIKRQMLESKELHQKLKDHLPVVRAHFLTRLLKGQTHRDDLNDQTFGYMGIQFPYGCFSVLLVEVDDHSGFARNDSEEEWALGRFILVNLSTELIGESGYVVETDRNRLAVLLSLPDGSDSSKLARAELIGKLKDVVENRFKMKITIAASSIHQDVREMKYAYEEALSALDYRIIHGINSSIYYDELVQLETAYYHYPIETEIQLMGYLKSGKSSHVVELLNELYEYNIVSLGITPQMGKCLFIDLLSTVMKVLGALQIDERKVFGGADPTKYIMNSLSAQEMLSKIQDLCQGICDSVTEARNGQTSQLNEDIRMYIEAHASDNGLGLTSIGDRFGLSPQYVSALFKKQNGINITDYIVETRMQLAKQHLCDPSLTILQVANKVGYATDIGFIRVFKKQEGMTPGKYREINAGSANIADSRL